MKIGNPADKPSLAPVHTGPTASPAEGTGKTALPAAVDPSAKVELSSAASSLMAGAGTAEFDAEKVARISKAIDDGSFKVNADVIADKLIANAQELLGKVQR